MRPNQRSCRDRSFYNVQLQITAVVYSSHNLHSLLFIFTWRNSLSHHSNSTIFRYFRSGPLQNYPLFYRNQSGFFLIRRLKLFLVSGEINEGGHDGVVYLGTKRFLAEGPGGDESDSPLNSSYLALAAKRTYRRDPLNGFKKYTGGYNITERHYWAVSSPQILLIILFLCFRKQFFLFLFLFGRNAIQMKTSSPVLLMFSVSVPVFPSKARSRT